MVDTLHSGKYIAYHYSSYTGENQSQLSGRKKMHHQHRGPKAKRQVDSRSCEPESCLIYNKAEPPEKMAQKSGKHCPGIFLIHCAISSMSDAVVNK